MNPAPPVTSTFIELESFASSSRSSPLNLSFTRYQPGHFWLTAVTRFGKAQIVTADMVGQEGDVLVFVSEIAATDALQSHIESGGEA